MLEVIDRIYPFFGYITINRYIILNLDFLISNFSRESIVYKYCNIYIKYYNIRLYEFLFTDNAISSFVALNKKKESWNKYLDLRDL